MADHIPRRPIRIVFGDHAAAILDADDRTIFTSTVTVCQMVEIAFNAYPRLQAETDLLNRTIEAVRRRLRAGQRTPAIADALALIDYAKADDELALEVVAL